MKMDKKQSYIHDAQKKQYGEKDIPEKFKVIDFLRQYKMYGLTDMHLLFLKEKGTFLGAFNHTFINDRTYFVHKPDIWIRDLNLVIEIDGYYVHGEEGFLTKKTEERNEHYHNGNINFIVINKEALKLAKVTWESFLFESLSNMGLIKTDPVR